MMQIHKKPLGEYKQQFMKQFINGGMYQWGNNEYKEPFLDESLTVFTTAYYFEKEYGKYHGSAVDATIRQKYIYGRYKTFK